VKTFLLSLMFSVITAFFAFNAGVYYAENEYGESVVYEATDAIDKDFEKISEEEPDISEIIEREEKNVVAIDSDDGKLSCGVIVSKKGYIAANNLGSEALTVTFSDGSVTRAKKVWSDEVYDIAILKTEAELDTEAEIGEVDSVTVGDEVIAIGASIGMRFQRNVLHAIVSSKDQIAEVKTDEGSYYAENLIATDFAVSEGQGGAPLINEKGETIGIMTENIGGFAVPLCLCEGVIKSLEEKGTFEEPETGICVCSASLAKYLMKKDVNSGLFVTELERLGGAYSAGMRIGDVIYEFNGESVYTPLELRRKILSSGKNSELIFSVKRRNEELKISFYLENHEEETSS